MRLLVADTMDVQVFEELKILGIELHYQPDLTKDTLPRSLDGIGILVVRSTEVSAEAIAAARQLNLIVRAGAGASNIDVAAASGRGIYVANCPGKNSVAVAELTMGLILSLDRRIADTTADLRAGRWEKTKYSQARGLFGRRIGIAGLGAVGREVLTRAISFGMEPHAWSKSLTASRASKMGVGYARTLEELASRSDVFTVHLPPSSHTKGIVSRAVLEALPLGAIFVNTARADLVDEKVLAEVVQMRGIKAGLDVFPNEPESVSAAFEAPMMNAGTVHGTPHIAASTEQAQRAIAMETAKIIRSFLTEEDIPNVVNICATSPARYAVVLRMLDKVGVLANTLSVFKRHGINIEEISNTVFEGAIATCTKLRVTGRPNDACLREIRAFDEVLHVDVISLPNLA